MKISECLDINRYAAKGEFAFSRSELADEVADSRVTPLADVGNERRRKLRGIARTDFKYNVHLSGDFFRVLPWFARMKKKSEN